MRLRRLDLTRYGKFTDHAIDFGTRVEGSPDLHIVYGLNEAGKSTSLSAYLDLLYGIEESSRYSFLHPYASMQVGACLEFNGVAHELKRIKKRSNSLLDAGDQPVADALLSAPLSGVSRDAYRTMFSLDDQTLEDGGEAILKSKGDLGELLFSASAGLAGVSATLAMIGDEADKLYRKRARSTRIAELKQRLAELKARRDEIDTQASAHQGLVASLAQATEGYDAAMRERGLLKARHEAVAGMLKARPLSEEYRRLEAELSALSDLPRPPAAWDRLLPKLRDDEVRLRTRLERLSIDRERLRAQIETTALDEAILAHGDRVAGLVAAQGRYSTAADDLPKRRLALAEREGAIAALLTALGRPAGERPEDLILPAAVIGTLRDLIEARSGMDATLRAAERELTNARAEYERDRDTGEGSDTGSEQADEQALERLSAALTVVRRSDHHARLRLAQRNLPELSQRREQLFAALDPFDGDAAALDALHLPEQRDIEAWRTTAADLDKRRAEHRERLRDLTGEEEIRTARIAAIRAASGPIDDQQAAEARSARDAAWQQHLATLDRDTADHFAERLAADDRMAAARISSLQDLAELRHLTRESAAARAAIARHETLLAEATAEAEALLQEIHGELPAMLGLGEIARPAILLSRSEDFLRRRAKALEAHRSFVETDEAVAAARAEIERDRDALSAALDDAGIVADADDLAALAHAAEHAIAGYTALRAERKAAEKARLEREQMLELRRREWQAARDHAEKWQETWQQALSETWFPQAGSTGAVREILDRLAELPGLLRDRDDLVRRVATMERDQDDFAAEVTSVLSILGQEATGLSPLASSQALMKRHAQALRDSDGLSEKKAEQERLEAEQALLEIERLAHEASRTELTTFFGVETLQDVAAALETSADRSRMEARLKELAVHILVELPAADIAAALDTMEGADFAELAREEAELAGRLEDLDIRREQLFAERTRAADRLDAIGGDDAVARIEAERRTLFLEIEEAALAHLRLRSGALIADHALRAYRDKHRSAMMTRASEAFRQITRGEYAGLAARPEKDRETLIGITRSGASKIAEEMSKGTRFQLYLALRLAGYEEFASIRPAVPFIADDIMETFDEPRSEEVLRLFGDMARIGQVIYLTHHRHLCDIASKVVPEVRIHEI